MMVNDDTDTNEARIESLLGAMTLEEKVALLAGASTWTTAPIERLGIPAIKVSDGPNGARGGGALIGGVPAAAFPVGIALAATWNTTLLEQIGEALAEEAHSKGARVLLAPTVNIHRSPLNGRNFECFSEDPYLSAQACVAYITGLQRHGVSATVKHFIGNESEFERTTMSSEIGERAMREIYLPPFEAAVRDANTWGIMSSYNRVGGTYVSELPSLLQDLLANEWGFDGIVMSDWFATHSTADAANAGLDLEMPGPTIWRGEKLVAAVQAGEVTEAAVTERARRVLRLIARVGAFDDPAIPDERAEDRPEHRALIRQAAAEGTVLLKNDGVLPLDPAGSLRVAVIGPNAKTAQIMGGGSSQINAHYRITPFEGVVTQAGAGITLSYEQGCTNFKMLPLLEPALFTQADGAAGATLAYFNNADLSGATVQHETMTSGEKMWFEPPTGVALDFSARFSGQFTAATSGTYTFSLVSAGTSRLLVDGRVVVDNWDAWQRSDNYFGAGSAEISGTIKLHAGQTYNLVVEYATPTNGLFGLRAVRIGMLPPQPADMLERAVQLAASSDVALLFVGTNGEWETEGSDRTGLALPGQQNELIARVAAANPRTVVVMQTGSPVAMPWLGDVAAVLQAWFPGQECGNAIADVIFGAANPSGKLPQTFPLRLEDNPAWGNYPGENGQVFYAEGVFVGYRHYQQHGIDTLFPFGFGLSYTTFAYSNLRLSAETIGPDEQLEASVDVTNTGAQAGSEVVQVYVHDAEASVARPPAELKGFRKVALAAGETKTVTITLDMRALAFWDEQHHTWLAEAGAFDVLVGGSSDAIAARATFHLAESAEWK